MRGSVICATWFLTAHDQCRSLVVNLTLNPFPKIGVTTNQAPGSGC
jgi:hypothetical protein